MASVTMSSDFGAQNIKSVTVSITSPYICHEVMIGKDPDAGRDWGQEEKGMTEDAVAGWHHQRDGHEFE